MAEKSARRLRLEESLAEDPGDQFLRYGLALQCLREGDRAEGRERLQALIADHPDESVAAYQQLGQSYIESGETDLARATLQIVFELRGVERRERQRDALLTQRRERLIDAVDTSGFRPAHSYREKRNPDLLLSHAATAARVSTFPKGRTRAPALPCDSALPLAVGSS